MTRKPLISLALAVAMFCNMGGAADGTRTLSESDLFKLFAGGVCNARIGSLVHYRGLNFVSRSHDLELLRRAGADQALLHEVVTVPRVGWPKPSLGNWQLRDVDVIDVHRIPVERAGYCYGKPIMYEDSDTPYALWEDT